MANLKLKNPGGGSLNFVSADSASDLTVTFPAVTGTAMVSGNMPAFSAYKSGSAQTISTGSYTKVTFNSEEFDTDNNFASSRFTPTVAGYYQINWLLNIGSGSGSYEWVSAIFKNGSSWKTGTDANSSQYGVGGSGLVYLNGTTDYVEIYTYQGSGGNKDIMAYQTGTWFDGILVRSA
jgi:hypothetical protein